MIPRYQAIARRIGAANRCKSSGNLEWFGKHWERIAELCADAPHGSGFDSGCNLSEDSTPERLTFGADFHHMNEHGSYDGWSTHTVIIRPSLEFGFDLRITGRDRNGIKDYISDVFHAWISEGVEE